MSCSKNYINSGYNGLVIGLSSVLISGLYCGRLGTYWLIRGLTRLYIYAIQYVVDVIVMCETECWRVSMIKCRKWALAREVTTCCCRETVALAFGNKI